MKRKLVIIGDNFMLPSMFREKIEAVCGPALSITVHQNNWPGEPLVHGHTTPGEDGLKEYFGDSDRALAQIGDAELLLTHLAPVTAPMLTQLPDLKFVAVSRGGPVNVNLVACKERSIQVVNTPARNASAVAEFTIGAILTETRKIRAGHEALRNGTWRDDLYRADRTGRELCEMTVGVLGYGAIGRRVVRLLSVFGCRILVTDPFASLSEEDREADVQQVDFDTLISSSDVLTLHPKVTPETQGLINQEALTAMPDGAILVNTTRGSLCDDAALYDALSSGKLAGAVLDTFTTEPPAPDTLLLSLPNVTMTPHIAGASVRTVAYAAEMAAEEVRRYLNGEPALNPV